MSASSRKPIAALSLDLDNLWSYKRADGQDDWESLESYLPAVVPSILEALSELAMQATIFVVGKDAEIAENEAPLRALAEAGHSIGNHSYLHEPWMHRFSLEAVQEDLDRSEAAIEALFGQAPRSFRAPGFSVSPQIVAELARRGYDYDASEFPTFIGPLARWAYFRSANLSDEEKAERAEQFGKFSDGFGPLRPYFWSGEFGDILEIPVTTFPLLKSPIHLTYVHYLAAVSEPLARAYFSTSLRLCRWLGVTPVILLHPLDFLASDAAPALKQFPGIGADTDKKRQFTQSLLRRVAAHFEPVTLCEFAGQAASRVTRRRALGAA